MERCTYSNNVCVKETDNFINYDYLYNFIDREGVVNENYLNSSFKFTISKLKFEL